MEPACQAGLLQACRTGDLMLLLLSLQQGGNPHCSHGWPLRRAVRYSQARVWRYLLSLPGPALNNANPAGLAALHTAARFDVVEAAEDLLAVPAVLPNLLTALGSSPLAVAAKYCSTGVVRLLVQDSRVELDSRDCQGRTADEVVGAALAAPDRQQRENILQIIREERERRKAADEIKEKISEKLDLSIEHFKIEINVDEGYFTE